MKQFWALLIFLFISSFSYAGDDKSVKATVTPEKGTVGTVFKYSISVAVRDGEDVSVELPEKKNIYPPKKEESGAKKASGDKSSDHVPLYIIHSAHRDVTEKDGLKQTLITVDLSCYRPGKHDLPEIKISGKDGIAIGYAIPAITIDELNKEGKETDVEAPLELSGNYTRLYIIIAASVLVLLILYFIYKIVKKYIVLRRKANELLPIELFERDVVSMRVRQLIDEGDINGYVFTMSMLFRKFLSGEFGFDAPEMTTDEIGRSLNTYITKDISEKFGSGMIDIMRFWDFSKFAEYTPTQERLAVNFDMTMNLARDISSMSGRIRGGDR